MFRHNSEETMNKNMIFGAVLVGLAGQSIVAMEQQEAPKEEETASWYDSLTSGRNLATAGLVVGGGYLLARKSETGKKGIELVKKHPYKAAAGAALVAAAGVYAHRRGVFGKLEVAGDVQDGLCFSSEATHKGSVSERVEALLTEVYGDSAAQVKKHLRMLNRKDGGVQHNVGLLVDDQQFVAKLNSSQKEVLLSIYKASCEDRVRTYLNQVVEVSLDTIARSNSEKFKAKQEKAVAQLLSVFSEEQEDCVAMLRSLVKAKLGFSAEQKQLLNQSIGLIEGYQNAQAALHADK